MGFRLPRSSLFIDSIKTSSNQKSALEQGTSDAVLKRNHERGFHTLALWNKEESIVMHVTAVTTIRGDDAPRPRHRSTPATTPRGPRDDDDGGTAAAAAAAATAAAAAAMGTLGASTRFSLV